MSASEGAAMNDAVLTQRRDEVLLITLNRERQVCNDRIEFGSR
jgi:hypothetical protein